MFVLPQCCGRTGNSTAPLIPLFVNSNIYLAYPDGLWSHLTQIFPREEHYRGILLRSTSCRYANAQWLNERGSSGSGAKCPGWRKPLEGKEMAYFTFCDYSWLFVCSCPTLKGALVESCCWYRWEHHWGAAVLTSSMRILGEQGSKLAFLSFPCSKTLYLVWFVQVVGILDAQLTL